MNATGHDNFVRGTPGIRMLAHGPGTVGLLGIWIKKVAVMVTIGRGFHL
jgi:hypothetical protein